MAGFLRELDFFLKNEVLNLDSLEAGGEARADGWFQMMQVIRRIGGKIIEFLAQLENFQKRLFEKKNFVTECHYCLTLDLVPEELYKEIVKNKKQLDEWKLLFQVEQFEDWRERPTKGFLKKHSSLIVDTRLFGLDFLDNCLAKVDGIDRLSAGTIFHGSNQHALQLMKEAYRGRVECVFTDPPYNTGGDGFIYKDRFQHSSWASLISDAMTSAYELLSDDGALFVTIDDNEVSNLTLFFLTEFSAGTTLSTR